MAASDPQTRLTASEFRKIELQSPADMQHLISVARRAARSKIDDAFPPSAAPKDGEDDGVRRRVEELVEGYIQDTFRGVREGVSVNGVDLTGRESVPGHGEDSMGECPGPSLAKEGGVGIGARRGTDGALQMSSTRRWTRS